MHSGRETIYRNGSLLLQKVSRNDTGFYTLQTYNRHAEILSTTAVYLHVHGKWFIVNCVNGVRFISLNTYSRVFCAYLFYALWPHVGVWEFIAGHIWCRIMAIEQNLSFDFTLYIDICMVGNSDKDISLFLDSWCSYQEFSLRKTPKGFNIVPGWGKYGIFTEIWAPGCLGSRPVPVFSIRSILYMLNFDILMAGTVLQSSQSLVMCGIRQCTVMRAFVGLCFLAIFFGESAGKHSSTGVQVIN